ncbi:hypothetical protein AURDEDRAFT_178032 [Auricularia subglabra TFB-10046 SS5]|uniref:Uncharacterized protein n=1 Tax=Auricularia subglabra (strain TFB-10046 / SS5) TaxID=717982 RepID=J0CRI5_AURST|nr:hypothetical protein AURDEDRAFT_178032 [Auricularia subglabra TFB-10046 SS5]
MPSADNTCPMLSARMESVDDDLLPRISTRRTPTTARPPTTPPARSPSPSTPATSSTTLKPAPPLPRALTSPYVAFLGCCASVVLTATQLRQLLHKLAVAHREHMKKQPKPPKSTTPDPRKRPPPEPAVSNDGGVVRGTARRAPLAAQPYQRSARPPARKHKGAEVLDDVPAPIVASIRAAKDDVLSPASIAASVDDLCTLFSSTSLTCAAPAAEDAPCDPAPAGAHRGAYLPTHVALGPSTPAAAATGTCAARAKPVPARINPLDRSGRHHGRAAHL